MKINTKKTKVMKISKNTGEKFAIYLDNIQLSQVAHFSYLGSVQTEDGYCENEIKCRIVYVKEAFSMRKELLTKSFNLTLKKKIIKTVICSILLYGGETWTIRMEERRRLESCEMWLWRKMLGILWSDKISNEEVLRRVGEERLLMEQYRDA